MSYARLSAATYEVHPEDRIANHSPLHFDMSTFGYFSGPWASATTVLIPEAYTKVPSSLAKLIENERITIWYSVPLALIQLLLRAPLDSLDLKSIRWVLYGGEPFPPKYLYQLMKKWPQARVSNVYGPAETNQCTFFHLPPLPPEPNGGADGQSGESAAIPIGQVWAETEGRILDAGDQPVAAGEPGQLVIHSPTMMSGYWNRPDLNQRAWYCEADGDNTRRFYRTGDLVRQRDDGNLLFLGRLDRQIKIRGYRVELDDVEHALASLPEVEEAAVFAVRQPDHTRAIEAAVILRPATSVEPSSLINTLARTFSPYAVPGRLQILNSFPRTTSGKIDRRQLQETAEARLASHDVH
jgi:acyl-coenzyme A synthetase/AMP-(fatty) acid ligase